MITKPIDRINEAYNGDLGEVFSEKTRSRVNWIVNNVRGKLILDIGCSQGIIPIILGREGKHVDALDIATESIEYAKAVIKNEHESVQENVLFKVSNFMTENDLKKEYDTILLTEVLEHISDPNSFLQKIYNHLSDSGTFVVTVPFGINDYFDHKRTYYFLELFDQLSVNFEVKEIQYLGKWTGVICTKREVPCFEQQNLFKREYIEKLEKGFYEIEKEFLNKFNDLHKIIKEKNIQIANLKPLLEPIKTSIPSQDYKVNELDEKLNTILDQLKFELATKNNQLQNKEVLYSSLQEEVTTLRRELFSSIESEKKAIKFLMDKEREFQKLNQEKAKVEIENKKIIYEMDELKDKYKLITAKLTESKSMHDKLKNKLKEIENKYNSLKNSKLGSLTLKYWKWRNK